MRDPATMLGHCVSCHQVFDNEGNLIQASRPSTCLNISKCTTEHAQALSQPPLPAACDMLLQLLPNLLIHLMLFEQHFLLNSNTIDVQKHPDKILPSSSDKPPTTTTCWK